jgi:hypothetical protein
MSDTNTTDGLSGRNRVNASTRSRIRFSYQQHNECRLTPTGLADLPCEPGQYDDFARRYRVNAGDHLSPQLDEALKSEDGDRIVMRRTDKSGICSVVETRGWKIKRGDEVNVHFERFSRESDATIFRVISADDPVLSPTFTYVRSDGDPNVEINGEKRC